MLFYTDGLIEQRGEHPDEGLERLRSAAFEGPADLGALCDHVIDTVLPSYDTDDDVTLLVLRTAADRAESLTLHVVGDEPSLRAFRGMLRRWLAAAGAAPDELHDVTMAANEAIQNAMEHAHALTRRTVDVTLDCHDLDVEVTVSRQRGVAQPARILARPRAAADARADGQRRDRSRPAGDDGRAAPGTARRSAGHDQRDEAHGLELLPDDARRRRHARSHEPLLAVAGDGRDQPPARSELSLERRQRIRRRGRGHADRVERRLVREAGRAVAHEQRHVRDPRAASAAAAPRERSACASMVQTWPASCASTAAW